MYQYAKMEMIATGESRAAGTGDTIPLGNHLARLNTHFTQMGIHAEKPEPMVDDDGVAVNTQIIAKDHFAPITGRHRGTRQGSQIDPQVDLLVYLLAVMSILPMIGKRRA